MNNTCSCQVQRLIEYRKSKQLFSIPNPKKSLQCQGATIHSKVQNDLSKPHQNMLQRTNKKPVGNNARFLLKLARFRETSMPKLREPQEKSEGWVLSNYQIKTLAQVNMDTQTESEANISFGSQTPVDITVLPKRGYSRKAIYRPISKCNAVHNNI